MTLPQTSVDQHVIPPHSPITYEPPVTYPYSFDIDYSREPGRIRAVFDNVVERTKEMNIGKPELPSGKRRARNLGLKVDIGQAKGLHWRSIQARQPVQIIDSPNSPPRTPRRPAMEYPSAEYLCLKNMADAQKRMNHAETYRWSYLAERERMISNWEAEQAEVRRVNQVNVQVNSVGPPVAPLQMVERDYGFPSLDESFSPITRPSRLSQVRSSGNIHRNPPTSRRPYDASQAIIEIPTLLMDRSQSLRPEGVSHDFIPSEQSQIRSMNIPHSSNIALQNAHLARSSMQRHIPAASLRMAPTPVRPRIDRHPVSYPYPQATALSFVSNDSQQSDAAILQDAFGCTANQNLPGASTSRLGVSPFSNAAPAEKGYEDDISLKKRRSEAEHFVSPKTHDLRTAYTKRR